MSGVDEQKHKIVHFKHYVEGWIRGHEIFITNDVRKVNCETCLDMLKRDGLITR